MIAPISPLQKKRLQYKPLVPPLLKNLNALSFRKVKSKAPSSKLKNHFPLTLHQPAYQLVKGKSTKRPLKLGVIFSGGQAAGGHNVIAAMIDGGAKVVGFLGGANGIVENKWIEIDRKKVAPYRNQGGFDLIGTGRTKIETAEQFSACLKTVKAHRLDGLVIIGGDDSNTNAAHLAEFFLSKGCETKVVGVPKTIDGDLQSEDIEISFGFDSACKTYGELIGNIARDAISSKKYYHFIKLMGRSASHITLECALATRPNLALIGEEGRRLHEIVGDIVSLIVRREKAGKEYGVVLVPEGLIEFIPELKKMIEELNGGVERLSRENRALFDGLPKKIQDQLLMEKDPHGNVQLSFIQTEVLLMDLVKKELKNRGFKGKFSAQEHFLGYEGRSCMPTNFDANYCYALGLLAMAIVREGLTGMICSIQGLKNDPRKWKMKAVPIVSLMQIAERKGRQIPVIQKTLVDTKGDIFLYFSQNRKLWEIEDQYRYPGPIQFQGEAQLTDSVPLSLMV